MSIHDENGQPINRNYNSARLNDRKIDELIGLCRGVLADGAVSLPEAQYMQNWMQANRDIADHWPANVLFQRIEDALADGKLSSDEEKDLLETLIQITGEPNNPTDVVAAPTSLPICIPAPEIEFLGSTFCFTGKFATGTRKRVQTMVAGLGGDSKSGPSKKVRYFVVGSVGSTDWVHSTHGRKIEKAVGLRESGVPIHIVTEEHWYKSIPIDVSL